MRVLVTGGAGFIGSHLVDGLLAAGHDVRILDALVPQVHPSGETPGYVDREAELLVGDVRDREAVAAALDGVEAVFHQAAAVGVGQSMYEVAAYCDANVTGTAILLEEVVEVRDRIGRLVVASSMSNYGEGRYRRESGEPVEPPLRPLEQFEAGQWELIDPETGTPLIPCPTEEGKPMQPTSVYATTKRDQEELVLNVGRAYDIPAVALRYFNVYGTRQSLSNPYTGVAAIFSGRLLNRERPLIFEDGKQSRDFTHVSDIVRANLAVLDGDAAVGRPLNVGTGTPTNLLELCGLLTGHLGLAGEIEPEIVGRFREGDVRHCYAAISELRRCAAYEPAVALEDGIEELVGWVAEQRATDRVGTALDELQRRSLVR